MGGFTYGLFYDSILTRFFGCDILINRFLDRCARCPLYYIRMGACVMFAIGDKIVYPMHGAGIIEKIEEKKILGETREYYILRVPFGEMKIMIPIEASEGIGVRPISSAKEMEEILCLMGQASTEMSDNWNRRYRENMEKLKTGSLQEVAEVVRNLTRVDRVKKLSTGEKKMLSNARQIFVSEMVLVQEITVEEAERIIASIV